MLLFVLVVSDTEYLGRQIAHSVICLLLYLFDTFTKLIFNSYEILFYYCLKLNLSQTLFSSRSEQTPSF